MPWWGWIIFGAFLLGSELMMVDAGFYLVFIGIAAMLTGLVELSGAGLEPWLQWLLFAVISLVAMVFFRRKVYDMLRGSKTDYAQGPVGDSVQLSETLAPGERCRMPFRGTDWTVLNAGTKTVEKGTYAQIAQVDGLTLKIMNAEENH
mgnify:CR=1 FL=1